MRAHVCAAPASTCATDVPSSLNGVGDFTHVAAGHPSSGAFGFTWP